MEVKEKKIKRTKRKLMGSRTEQDFPELLRLNQEVLVFQHVGFCSASRVLLASWTNVVLGRDNAFTVWLQH